jgi:hypothetical protein
MACQADLDNHANQCNGAHELTSRQLCSRTRTTNIANRNYLNLILRIQKLKQFKLN